MRLKCPLTTFPGEGFQDDYNMKKDDFEIPKLNDFESSNRIGFKSGDKVKLIKNVDSSEVGVVDCVIGPLLAAENFLECFKVMVNFPSRGQIACNPKNLKRV